MKAYIEVELDVESIKEESGEDVSDVEACLMFGEQFADWAVGTSIAVKKWTVEDGENIAEIKF